MTSLGQSFCRHCGYTRMQANGPCPACGMSAASACGAPPALGSFVGRHSELRLLHDILGDALAGHGQVAMLSGEAGMGKTRLAHEVATLALRRGMLALWGRCPEEAGAPPFHPWTRAMQACLQSCHDERLSTLLGHDAAAAVEIVPELAARLPPGTAISAIGGDQARFRLFAAVAHFWRQAAALRPLVVILDNLHWADASSLRLLAFLAHDIGENHMLLLGSYREAELSRQHPLTATLAELLNSKEFHRLPLHGLSLDETERLVAAATTAPPIPATVAAIHRRTEGNPLYLLETLRFMHEGLSSNDPGAAAALVETVPGSIRAVIGQRLNRLSPPCCTLLAIAACIGRAFDLPLLSELTDEPSGEAALLRKLDEAIAHHIIEPLPPGPDYQFSHVLIREVLYDELPVARRVALHGRIVQALRVRHQGDLDAVLTQLAYHAAAALPAGRPEHALELAQRAAAHAAALMAFEEALRCYQLALQLQERWLPAERGRHCALLLALGTVQMHVGEHDASANTFLAAATLARSLGDADLFAQAALGFENNGWRISRPGEQAAALLEEALADADGFDPALRVDLLAALCRACIFCGRQLQADAVRQSAIELARTLALPQPLFNALTAILPARHEPTQLDQRLLSAQEAFTVAENAGHLEWVDALTGWYFGDLVEKGELDAARALVHVHRRIADTIRQPFMQTMGLASLTLLAAYEGRFADAERLADETFTIGQRFLPGNAQGAHSLQIFVLRRHQGRLGEVLAVLRSLIGRVPPGSLWQPGLALICTELDLLEPAREAYEIFAADDFSSVSRDGMWLTNIVFAAEVCARLGDQPRATTLYQQLAPYAGRNVVTGTNIACFGAVDRYRAMLAALVHDDESAGQHFAAAVALDERCGGRPWLAHSRYEWARWQIERGGDRAAAQGQLDAALALCRELGMTGLAQRCDDLQRKLGATSTVAASTPDALSPREFDVLRLLSAGLTNQAIGARLFISPHTVAHHVRHILTKTDCRNRTEAAAWAHQHDLGTQD